ncbi:MFS transporter [Chloroflexota bacterium]
MPSWLKENLSSGSNSKTEKGQLYYGWVIVAACLIIFLTVSGIRFSFGVFFKSLEEDFGWTRAVTSGVFSLSSLLGCVFVVIGGWALDRYGPKVVFTVMGFSVALGLVLTSQATTIVHLYLSYSLLLAIGIGPGYVVVTSTVSRWFTKRRGLALGIATSGIGLGTIIMTPVAVYLISSYGWRLSYLIMAITAFFIIIPCAQLLRKWPREATAQPEGEMSEPINQSSPEETNYNELRGYSPLQATKTKNFWLFISIWFFYSLCLFMVMAHIVRHGIDLGFNPMQASSILSVIGGTSVAGRLIMGRVSDSIGRKQAAVISALLMAGAMLCLIKASSLWMLYLFAVIFGFSYGGISPPIGALIAETFGLRRLGAIMGILEIGWAPGAALGPALAGHLFDISGSYVFAFLAGLIAMLIVVASICFLKAPAVTKRNRML